MSSSLSKTHSMLSDEVAEVSAAADALLNADKEKEAKEERFLDIYDGTIDVRTLTDEEYAEYSEWENHFLDEDASVTINMATGEIVNDETEDNEAMRSYMDSFGGPMESEYLPGFEKAHFWNSKKDNPQTSSSSPSMQSTPLNNTAVGFSGHVYGKSCTHKPTHVIDGSDEGWGVWAGKGSDCEDQVSEFDVILNLTGRSIIECHSIPIPELKKWENGNPKYEEMVMDWPDYGVVTLPLQFWLDLVEYARDNKKKILVFCVGGHGRTGTAVALMLIAALDYTALEAINWVKKNYCHKAIESHSQMEYVHAIGDEMKELKKVEKGKM